MFGLERRVLSILSIIVSSPLICTSLLTAENPPKKPDYLSIIRSIAKDVETHKAQFPQLANFSVTKNFYPDQLTIEYTYHTHKAQPGGGWTSGVPNPDDDGIWFFVDIHEASSIAQIHTQPAALPPLCLVDMRVAYLMLEGKQTKSIASMLWPILQNHGIKPCKDSPGTE